MKYNIFVLDTFSTEIKKLSKKYKSIKNDLQELLEDLEEDPKNGSIFLGKNCFKIRMKNSSIPTGKSGGFRIIYYFIDENNNIYLMSIYSKSDQANISDEKILEILKENDLS